MVVGYWWLVSGGWLMVKWRLLREVSYNPLPIAVASDLGSRLQPLGRHMESITKLAATLGITKILDKASPRFYHPHTKRCSHSEGRMPWLCAACRERAGFTQIMVNAIPVTLNGYILIPFHNP